MKCILVFLGLVAISRAQSCDNSFGAYLNALKGEITSSSSQSRQMEQEFTDDYHKLIRKCFAQSTDDGSRCALSDEELNSDIYGDNGPLRGCGRCQGLARGLRDKYMHSKEDVRKCFRRHFAQAVREELEPCIQGKISDFNFHVPEIPDFDEKTFESIDIAERGVNYRIYARSRLDACQNVNPGKHSNTSPCIRNGYPGIYSKHCQAARNAKSNAVSSSCNGRFDRVKGATCKCMEEKREDWHNRFSKIQGIVNNAQSANQCGQDISNVIGSWLNKIQSALNNCLPKEQTQGKQTNLRTLIELGCGQVINGGVKKNELTVGFRFIRLFLDALNDRITVFCENCNF